MCSSETKPSAIFTKRVYWTVVPFLGIAMILTTAVAGIPGIFIYKDAVGPEYRRFSPYLLTAFFFIFFNTTK